MRTAPGGGGAGGGGRGPGPPLEDEDDDEDDEQPAEAAAVRTEPSPKPAGAAAAVAGANIAAILSGRRRHLRSLSDGFHSTSGLLAPGFRLAPGARPRPEAATSPIGPPSGSVGFPIGQRQKNISFPPPSGDATLEIFNFSFSAEVSH